MWQELEELEEPEASFEPSIEPYELDELEAQITFEQQRLAQLEKHLSVHEESSETEPEEDPKAMEVINKLGISTEQLLVAPATPPLPSARAAPRTPPDEAAAVSALQSLLAPSTPPLAPARPKESPGVRMFVSSLEQVAQESGHLATSK